MSGSGYANVGSDAFQLAMSSAGDLYESGLSAAQLLSLVGIVEITDAAKTGFYPCVQLPNGKVVVGAQLITGNYG